MSVTLTTSPCFESSFLRFVRVPCIKVTAAERVEGSGSIVEFDSAAVLNTNREKFSAGTRLMMKVQRRKKSQLKDFFSAQTVVKKLAVFK